MSRPGFTAMAVVTADHKLVLNDMKAFSRKVRLLRPATYVITVEEEIASRSDRQNRYYFAAVVAAIQDYTGDDRKAVHEMLKAACNPVLRQLVNKTGKVIGEYWEGGSTVLLSVAEFSDYIERCQQWAAEHCDGLVIEDANPEERAAWRREEAA